MDHMQAYALKQADPKYTAYDVKIRDAHSEKRKINAKQCTAMRHICQLNHALDVVRHKSWDFETTSAKQDKVLEEATLTDGEGWFWTYHNAGEEMEKMMIQKCIKVANLAANYDALSERITSLIAEQKKYGDNLVKKAQQKEESK